MSKNCKHKVLVRLDESNKPVVRSTPQKDLSEYFQCKECGSMFYSMVTDKPLLIEQVALS